MAGLSTVTSRPGWRLGVATLMIPVALAACGGDEAAPRDGAGQQSADGARVGVQGLSFEPATLEVPVGTTVSWTNDDSVAHTVTSGTQGEQGAPGVTEGKAPEPDGTFDGDLEAERDEFEFTFDEAGTYPYYCDIHRQMTGEVVVG
jgi:plastocyanin